MREKYGLSWGDEIDDAQIESFFIRQGGIYITPSGQFGLGLFQHFKNYWSLLWPADDQTRWTDLLLKTILENQFVAVIGPASSWKTGTVSRIALMDWSVFPECTTVIQSSTTMDGLRARVFGETTRLWRRAAERYAWFPGHPLDHRCVIVNDDIDDEVARDSRDAIVGVPCQTSTGAFMGMGKYSGRKNRRVWCVSDELQFMERALLDSQNNLVSNGPNLVPGILSSGREAGMPMRGYKAVFIGNPNPTRPENPLHIVAEPEGGWASLPDDKKTKTWTAKQVPESCVKCVVVNLDGADSPNNDFPGDTPNWPHLVHRDRIAMYQEGSEAYWSQGRGVVKLGLAGYKIITKELCDQHNAFDQLVWDDGNTTKIGMVDAAYSGVHGDRCPVGWLEFGKCVDGVTRILVHPYVLVPVIIRPDISAEDQIAIFCKQQMEDAGVPAANFFFDGRGSLAISFARIWSPEVNSLEFGGKPTERLAGPDVFYIDPKTGAKRLKKASEHYANFVSELWWSAANAIQSDQVRGLTIDVVMDASPREYKKVRDDKVQIEPKREMKKRTAVSPDLADWFCIGVEGARRRGFQISSLGADKPRPKTVNRIAADAQALYKLVASKQLQAS